MGIHTKILFRDDDDLSTRMVQSALEGKGYRVACISDTRDDEAGLDFGPDLVVLNADVAVRHDPCLIEKMAARRAIVPVVLGRSGNPADMLAVQDRAGALNVPILGTTERPYGDQALVHFLEGLDRRRMPAGSGDEHHIRTLIASNRLIPNLSVDFQGKYELARGSLAGYEALARLATRRSMNPEAIFSDSMDFGVEVDATAEVLDQVARLAVILSHSRHPKPVSFNCSASVIVHGNFCAMVEAALAKHRLDPRYLMVEITEEARIAENEGLVATCECLRDLGVSISIDDFGSGLANLDRVAKIPFSEIKIDKTAFWAACEDRLPMAFISSIIDFCKKRKKAVVIEGIETEAHLAQALSLGADYGQGYYWGRPTAPQIFAPHWP
jgi:EAL domain-containing protein (putative c-di-GMP-specific phosphodiesterase class I)/CheY-like chemotaxis protein